MQNLTRFFSTRKPDQRPIPKFDEHREVLYNHDEYKDQQADEDAKSEADLEENDLYNEARSLALIDEDDTCLTILHQLSQSHNILKRLGAGTHASVYAIIPKDYADYFLADLTSETPESIAFDVLRNAAVAVKIASGPLLGSATAAVAMRHEIAILKTTNCGAMHSHDQEDMLWFTMPMISGEALLTLHDKDVAHSDLHRGNVMLRPNPSSEYPDVVLVDFGRAQVKTGDPRHNAWDVYTMLNCLYPVFESTRELECWHDLSGRSEAVKTGEEVRALLKDVIEIAERKKESLDRSVPVTVTEYFETALRTMITDEEIKHAIPALS